MREHRRIADTARLLLLVLLLFSALSSVSFAQPSPHNVNGRIFNDGSGGSGVHNGVWVWLNSTVSGDFQTTRVNAPPLPQFRGSYSATISGSDNDLVIVHSFNATHWGTSNATLLPTTTTIDVYLNRTRNSEPNVTILFPPNLSLRNTTDAFNVTVNISIKYAAGVGCNVSLWANPTSVANLTDDQNKTHILGDIAQNGHVIRSWNLSGRSEGRVNVTVRAQCQSDFIYFDMRHTQFLDLQIADTSPPVINLGLANNTWVRSNFTIPYNVSEGSGLINCSLYVNNQLNQTTYGPPAYSPLNFTLNGTPDGTHTYFISCFDNSTNQLRGNSSLLTFFADSNAPLITLLSPYNGSALENWTTLFRYNVTDAFNATNCTLSLNNVPIQSNDSILLNHSNNFSVRISGGDYNWSVNCTDNAFNRGHSGYFSLFSADLALDIVHFVLGIEAPVDRQLVDVNVTVFNVGRANMTRNATVRFLEYDRYLGTTELASFGVNITSGGNVTLNITYFTRIGSVSLVVEADTPLDSNGSIVELLESNNRLNRTFNISAYNIFYGNVVSNFLLQSAAAVNVYAWINATSFDGNLYVADSDSTIDFSGLVPLGRNASKNESFDDFAELDLALNMTNVSDSLNRTFLFDGLPMRNETFSVFSNRITEVAVINSTNTSAFLTGILWDYTDSLTGNYSGTQDVLFVTRINRSQEGYYGLYDYEVRVPARLTKYAQPNLQDTISFYREII